MDSSTLATSKVKLGNKLSYPTYLSTPTTPMLNTILEAPDEGNSRVSIIRPNTPTSYPHATSQNIPPTIKYVSSKVGRSPKYLSLIVEQESRGDWKVQSNLPKGKGISLVSKLTKSLMGEEKSRGKAGVLGCWGNIPLEMSAKSAW